MVTHNKIDHQGYISCYETVTAAFKRGLSVCDYLEDLWDQRGATQKVINAMAM